MWRSARWAAALACLLVAACHSTAQQQPCNPVIDGTYCATQMPRGTRLNRREVHQSDPGHREGDLGESNSPGTLGGISFRSGGTTCIGLLRRGNCS